VGIRSLRFVLWLAALLLPLLVGCQSVEGPVDGMRWGEPEPMEDGESNVRRPQIAAVPTGGVIAVWDQTDRSLGGIDGSDDIWTRRADHENGWESSAARIDDLESADTFGAQIAVSDNGSAIIVFVHEETEGDPVEDASLWAVHSSQTGAWEQELLCINSTPGDPECRSSGIASNPRVAVDPEGNAVVVWEQSDGPDSDSSIIFANRFAPGLGWSGASQIVDDVQTTASPHVAIDASGNAMVVWEQIDATERSSIWSRRLPSDRGPPESAQPLELNDDGDAFDPQIAIDRDGNAIAVWREQETEDGLFDILSNRYDPSSGTWGNLPTRVATQNMGDAQPPQIAMTDDGNGIVVWAVSGGPREGVWSSRYSIGSGWGEAVSISAIGLGSVRHPRVAIDEEGNAIAVWVQFDGARDRIWSSSYAANRGWGARQSVEAGEEDKPFRSLAPRVAIDPSGNAVAIWVRDVQTTDGVLDLWSSRLEP